MMSARELLRHQMFGLFVGMGFRVAYAEHLAGNFVMSYMTWWAARETYAITEPAPDVDEFLRAEAANFPDEWGCVVVAKDLVCPASEAISRLASNLVEFWKQSYEWGKDEG